RTQHVVNSKALTQKFRAPRDLHAIAREVMRELGQPGCCSDWHRRFPDDHRWFVQQRKERGDSPVHVLEVSSKLALLLRGPDSEKKDVGKIGSLFVVRRNPQPAAARATTDDFAEPRFKERNVARRKFNDLTRI